MKYPLIAFIGYARTGKDTAAETLIAAAGYNKVAFGNIIKQQLDQLVQRHLGFSAFTEIDAEKTLLRPILEQWGEVNYANIFNHFFDTLPTPAVNTRLCRVKEAREWIARGGVIYQLVRPGVGPETDWSRDRVEELWADDLVKGTLYNYGTPEDLAETVRKELL